MLSNIYSSIWMGPRMDFWAYIKMHYSVHFQWDYMLPTFYVSHKSTLNNDYLNFQGKGGGGGGGTSLLPLLVVTSILELQIDIKNIINDESLGVGLITLDR